MLDDSSVLAWFGAKLAEAQALSGPLAKLHTDALVTAWGKPGEPGDPKEIQHVSRMIGTAACRILSWEEEVRFIYVGDTFRDLVACLPGTVGRNLNQLQELPKILDAGVDWLAEAPLEPRPEGPKSFDFTIVFDLPDGWERRVDRELDKLRREMRLQT